MHRKVDSSATALLLSSVVPTDSGHQDFEHLLLDGDVIAGTGQVFPRLVVRILRVVKLQLLKYPLQRHSAERGELFISKTFGICQDTSKKLVRSFLKQCIGILKNGLKDWGLKKK